MTAPETIAEFNRRVYHSEDVLFIRLLRAKGLTDEQIASFIEVLWEVCPECYNSLRGCQCWNDE